MAGGRGQLIIDRIAVAPCQAGGFDGFPHHIAIRIILELGLFIFGDAVGRIGDVVGRGLRDNAVAFLIKPVAFNNASQVWGAIAIGGGHRHGTICHGNKALNRIKAITARTGQGAGLGDAGDVAFDIIAIAERAEL